MRSLSLTLLVIVALTTRIYAEDKKFVKPDYKRIEKEVKDEHSKWYYPRLMERFRNNDTTLKLPDFRMLYYGYFFNEKYSSYEHPDAAVDSLNKLMAKDVWTATDKENVVKYARRAEAASPLNMHYLFYIVIGYSELKDERNLAYATYMMRGIVDAVMSTGDGLSEATALHVLRVGDEYEMLKMLGYRFGGSQSLTGGMCDYLKVAENDDKVSGIYFDVTQLFAGYQKMFSDDSKGKKKK